MKRMLLIILGLFVTACWPQQGEKGGKGEKAGNAAIEALSRPLAAGFARALKPRAFRFPADDGPHPEFQTEWWYFTGNLETKAQRHFGYELTFFRSGLAPGADPPDDWPTRQIYFAHFTLSDIAAKHFYPFERWGRQSIGLAGAQSRSRRSPFKVWIDNWSIADAPGGALRLQAGAGEIELKLDLRTLKPTVLQGERGLSRKSADNASYYYSRTRIASSGSLRIGAESHLLSGLSWMDREWSTSALSPQQSGWDWFSLQLDDGRELMLYQLRLKNGGIDSFSSGTLVQADGSSRHLGLSDFSIEPQGSWTSPHTGIRYPSGWHIAVPSAKLDLSLDPWMPDQELTLGLRYWEGAVRITGSATGQGYVELTGYEEGNS
ncbi:MAG TPA: lipocalin-like domain-containing protein [Candidatus Obscuribacterales bacterium]